MPAFRTFCDHLKILLKFARSQTDFDDLPDFAVVKEILRLIAFIQPEYSSVEVWEGVAMTIQLNFFVHILGDLAWPEDTLVPHGEELAWILYEGLKSRGVDAKEPEWCDYEYSIDCVEAGFTFRLTTGIEHMDDSHSIWYLQPIFPRVARKNVDKALLALKDLLEVANEVLAQSK